MSDATDGNLALIGRLSTGLVSVRERVEALVAEKNAAVEENRTLRRDVEYLRDERVRHLEEIERLKGKK